MFEKVDFSKSKQYSLSIRLGTDGFSFSIANPLPQGDGEEHLHTAFHPADGKLPLTANLKQAFHTYDWLKRPFRRTNILVPGRRHTLVPLELFEDEQVKPLFHYNLPEKPNEFILYNILKKSNIVVLFGVNRHAASYLEEQLPDARFYSSAGTFIEHFTAESRQGNSQKLYVCFTPEGIELYAYEHGRLLLSNSYPCKEMSDTIYYTLYTWKQLGFEQERDELVLCGALPHKESLLPELRKFVRNVLPAQPAVSPFDLYAITTCE
ncbi:MAG: DUF3822 family protein [Prevotellaceae bacterium]|jgi:hypothetical protein|nr:DUF3822 family protein [Prevotellaceae bacterium]